MSQIQQEHARNEQIRKADHNEELKRAQLQAENELKEVIYIQFFVSVSTYTIINSSVIYNVPEIDVTEKWTWGSDESFEMSKWRWM